MSRVILDDLRIAERVPGAVRDVIDGGGVAIATVSGVDETDRGSKPSELAVAAEDKAKGMRGKRGSGTRGDVVGVEGSTCDDDIDEVRRMT